MEPRIDFKIVGFFSFIPLAVPEVVDAFAIGSDEDFQQKYGFPKPDKIADEVVVGCQVGIRAGNFAKYLQQVGFTKVRYFDCLDNYQYQ